MAVSKNGRSYWLNDEQVVYMQHLIARDIQENDHFDEDEEKMRQHLRKKLEVKLGDATWDPSPAEEERATRGD